MADIKITDLVDEKVFSDLEKLSAEIKDVKDKYIEAATELAKGLNMKIATSGDVARFNETIAESGRKAQEATDRLNETIAKQREIVSKTTSAISRELAEIEKENKAKRDAYAQDKSALEIAESLLGTRQQNIQRLAQLQGQLKKVKKAQKDLDDQEKAGAVSAERATAVRASLIAKQREYQAAIKDLNLVLTNQEKQMQASDGSYQKLSLQLEMIKKAYKSLNDEEKNSDIGRKLGEEIGEMDAHLKELAADMGEFQRNTGNYAIANQNVKTELRELVQEIAMLTIQYRNMSDEERASAQGQELEQKMRSMTERASELRDAVDDVNREIKSGANDTGTFSAFTEGINMVISGVGGLTAASHALGLGERDLIKIQTNLQAALAASNALTKAQTALQGESNLMVGVARVQQMAHAAAIKMKTTAESESVIVSKAATVAQAAFNAVAKANPYVLLATGIGLLVAAVVGFTKATKSETEEQKKAREEMEKSRKEYEDFIDVEKRLQEAREKGVESCSDEIAKLHVLYNAATDTTRSIDERRKAVDKLQELYPEYLGNLEDEAIMAGQAEGAYDSLTEAIYNKAIAEASQKVVTQYFDKYFESLSDIKKAREELTKAMSDYTKEAQKANEADLKNIEQQKNMPKQYGRLQAEYDISDAYTIAGRASDKNVEDARKRAEEASQKLSELIGQSEELKKAAQEFAKEVSADDLLSVIGGSSSDKGGKTHTPKPDKTEKEETVKSYEEIKEVILQNLQEIIAERIKMTEAGSKEEYELTIQYIDAEEQLRLIEIQKRYDKQREELKKNFEKEKSALAGNLEAQKALQERFDADIKEMENEHRQQQINAEKTALSAKEKAQDKYMDAYIDKMQKMYAEEQEARDLNLVKELTALTEARAKHIITEEEYQRQLAEMKMQYAIQTAQKEIEMLEKVLEVEELTADKRKEIAGKLAEAKQDLAKELADIQLKATKTSEKEEDAAAKKREKNVKQFLRLASQMASKVNSLVSAIYDGQIQKIEEEQKQAEKAHDDEIERIEQLEETGAITKEEAEARKMAAEQRSAEKNEELEKKKSELKHKQAVWDKASSVVEATIATSVAIVEALKAGPFIGPIMAAIIGAMGAIEIAAIIATPIPAYAKGTKDKDGHPGGLAIVGDAGKKEAVLYNNKMWITPDTPTLIDMPKGAVVYPDADRIPEPVFMTVMPNGEQDSKPIVIVKNDSKKIEKGIAQTNSLIKQSIIMQRRLAYNAAFESYKARRL